MKQSDLFKVILRSGLFLFIFTLVACTTSNKRYLLSYDCPPNFKINIHKIPDAVPKSEPLSKHGNPKSYTVLGRCYYVMKNAKGYHAKGIASWYGMKFHRFKTANGEIYNVAGMTAAHRTLPLPTYLQVTNLHNGKRIIVKVNDRGPFVNNRLIDLSYAAAKKLNMTGAGTAPVEIRAITSQKTQLILNQPSYKNKKIFANKQRNETKPFIQLGIFKQRYQAQKLALLVQTWTNAIVRIKTISIHKRYYYQVVIGPLPNIKYSKQLHHQLQLAGLNQSTKKFK